MIEFKAVLLLSDIVVFEGRFKLVSCDGYRFGPFCTYHISVGPFVIFIISKSTTMQKGKPTASVYMCVGCVYARDEFSFSNLGVHSGRLIRRNKLP